MTNPPTDCSLAAGSVAIGAGQTALHSAYATFSSRYGIGIAVDRAEVARPQGAVWDIGAYERVGG